MCNLMQTYLSCRFLKLLIQFKKLFLHLIKWNNTILHFYIIMRASWKFFNLNYFSEMKNIEF